MKYIDAEKLKAEIERYKQGAAIARFDNAGENADYFQGKVDLCDDLTHIITSLQQEPRFPQYDNIVDKVFGAGNLEGFEYNEAEMLVALAKEELLKSLQQEQPEVDLEKDVVSYCYDNGINISPRQAKTIALHFYGLGLSARKEAAEDREATAENNALKWL